MSQQTDRNDRVVVIGAGIGGLAAALRLASAGREVLVLERAATPGGKMRTLPSAAGPVDAGPTVMTMRPVFEDLFAAAGEQLEDHVTLHSETVLARHWWGDGSTLDLHADAERSAEAIREFAGPKAEAQFRRFAREAALLYDAFDAPMMREPGPNIGQLGLQALRRPAILPALAPWATLARRLKAQFTDPRLRQLFGRYATYVGGSPYASPAVLGLIWHAEASGVWRVEGGMHKLAQTIHALAETRGVTFRFSTDVAEIEEDGGQIRAVRTAKGECIATNTVLFNGDPCALATGLLGQTSSNAVPTSRTGPRSLSAYVWSFAAKPEGRDLAHHNVFFGDDPRREFDPLAKGQMPEDPTLYICAEDRGAGLAPDGLERFEIIMNGPPARGSAPEREFETCQMRTFDRLERMRLKFSDRPRADSLTTPRGFNALFPGSQGSLYGRSPHGLMAAFQRPRVRSRIKGLYLCGGGVHPGAGIPMATLSGQHAAEAIMSDRTSTSRSRQTAMPGGMSMGSAPAAPAQSRSSLS